MKINRITHERPVRLWKTLKFLLSKHRWSEIIEELPCAISRFLDKPDPEQLVDEVVIKDADVHLERMDNGTSILIVSDPYGAQQRVRVAIWAAGKDDLRVRAEVE